MERISRSLLISLGIALVVYLLLSLYADMELLSRNLLLFSWSVLPVVLFFSLLNYLFRFLKWSLYLRVLEVDLPVGTSLLIFLAGLAMSVTPGKLGELLKAFLLRSARGIPVARSAPIVLAERLTDFLALFLLSLLGIFSYQASLVLVIAGLGAVTALLAVVASRSLSLWLIQLLGKLPVIRRVAKKLEEAYLSLRSLVRPRFLLGATALSVVAWFFECLGFHVVLGGFGQVEPSLRLSTFIYSVATMAGAPSPGGLGLTEGGMVGLTQALQSGATPQMAVAATLVTRLCTLWLAVAIGLLALWAFQRWVGSRPSPSGENKMGDCPA